MPVADRVNVMRDGLPLDGPRRQVGRGLMILTTKAKGTPPYEGNDAGDAGRIRFSPRVRLVSWPNRLKVYNWNDRQWNEHR
ncbi:hypothetical protein JTB14_013777 [Gonioctena quinquepunctata]|nr:hypothetical protein JTB14_013777 [Gonioctena quinquepunctata]